MGKQQGVGFGECLHLVAINLWALKSGNKYTQQLNPVLLWVLLRYWKILREEAPSVSCNVCCYKDTPQIWGQEELESQDVNIKLNTLDLPTPGMGADCYTSSKVKVCNPMGHQSWESWEKASLEIIRLASDEQVPERKRQINNDMASCPFCKKQSNSLETNRTQINSLAWWRWDKKSLCDDGWWLHPSNNRTDVSIVNWGSAKTPMYLMFKHVFFQWREEPRE